MYQFYTENENEKKKEHIPTHILSEVLLWYQIRKKFDYKIARKEINL